MILTYRYKLLPTKKQHARLLDALDHTRDLYNAGLQNRIDAYNKGGVAVNYNRHCKDLTELRGDPEWSMYAATMQRWPLKKLDLAFRAFFDRVKKAENQDSLGSGAGTDLGVLVSPTSTGGRCPAPSFG